MGVDYLKIASHMYAMDAWSSALREPMQDTSSRRIPGHPAAATGLWQRFSLARLAFTRVAFRFGFARFARRVAFPQLAFRFR